MSEKISQKMRSFLVSNLIQSTKNLMPASWKANTYYTMGTKVVSNGKVYIAINTGNSSTLTPTHTNGIMLDGTVQWLYTETAVGVLDIGSNFYLGIGKNTEWNEDDTVEEAKTTPNKEREVLNDLITLIRLNSNNLRMGLKKEDWVSGRVFSQYDPSLEPSSYTNPFYTTVNDGTKVNIYKCIDNNSDSQSTDEPTGEQLGYVLMSDGYIWKYMGSVETIDEVQFSTNDFYPVVTKYTNDGSNQWQVQEQAQPGSVSSFENFSGVGPFTSNPTTQIIGIGSGCTAGLEYDETEPGVFYLDRVYCATGGSNYDEETYVVVKNSIDADGSDAEVSLKIEDGKVSLDNLIGGSGYTNGAILVIIGDGWGAQGTVTVSSGVVSVVDIIDEGQDYTWAKGFIIPGDAGVVSKARLAPASGHGKNLIAELSARTAIFSIQIDETLSPFTTEGEYRQVSLLSSIQSTNPVVQNSQLLIGPKHPSFEEPSFEGAKYLIGSGHLLFINNFDVVTHSSEQEEIIKIALTF